MALSVGVSRRAYIEARVLGGRAPDQHRRTAVLEDSLLLDLDPTLERKKGRECVVVFTSDVEAQSKDGSRAETAIH